MLRLPRVVRTGAPRDSCDRVDARPHFRPDAPHAVVTEKLFP
jgi:hypothetical protein